MNYAAQQFIDQVYQELQNRGYANQWNAGLFADALIRAANTYPPPMPTPPAVPIDESSLHTLSDNTMIHEMLRRGFAVMPMPKDGGVPEVLRS